MITYSEYIGLTGQEFILRINEDGSQTSFAKDESNPDYQAYLASLEKGEPKAE